MIYSFKYIQLIEAFDEFKDFSSLNHFVCIYLGAFISLSEILLFKGAKIKLTLAFDAAIQDMLLKICLLEYFWKFPTTSPLKQWSKYSMRILPSPRTQLSSPHDYG